MKLFVALLISLVAASASAIELDVPKEAHEAGAEDKGAPRVHAYLLADAASLTPGETFRVGVLFVLDEHYHIYWRNPGQAAIATDVRFSAPHVKFGNLAWPAPKVFRQADGFITTYGYTDEVLLYTTATVDEKAQGELTIKVETDYLACEVDCTPGTASLSRTIPVQQQATPAPTNVVKLFDAFAARVPRSPEELGLHVTTAYDVSAVKPGAHFKAAVAVVACDGPPAAGKNCPAYQVPGTSIEEAFVPDRIPGLELKAVASRAHPHAYSGLIVDVAGVSSADEHTGTVRFSGVLELEREDGSPAFVQFDAPLHRVSAKDEVQAVSSPLLVAATIGAALPVQPSAPPAPALAIWQALILAFIGGLVLNLMPCVLPVLAIKVTSFTQLGSSRASVFKHAMAYTAGIVLAMLSLAAVVLAFRAGGHAVGWGFQFQEPVFVSLIAAVLVVFAANLFGAFELSIGGGALAGATNNAHGVLKSGLEGVLAVVVATPCSAPFLGTAVGFALAGEPWLTVASFTMIGIGLAAPFVLLCLSPRAMKLIPKPGMWMVRFKQLMGFALLATVVWLAWVVGQSTGVDGMTGVIALSVAVGLASFVYGAGRESSSLVRVLTLALALAPVFISIRFNARAFDRRVVVVGSATAWEPFAPEKVSEQLARGKVVFVDFTADWCITCKVNERAVLASDEVTATTRKLDVTLMKADWTQRDDRIREELARYGRAGVPMYLVYSPKRPTAPTVLPELLTTDIVVAELERAGK